MAKRKTKLPQSVAEMTLEELEDALDKASDASYATEVALAVRAHPGGERLLTEAALCVFTLTDIGSKIKSVEQLPTEAEVAAARAQIQKGVDLYAARIESTAEPKLKEYYVKCKQVAETNLLTAGLPPEMTKFTLLYREKQAELAEVVDKWAAQFPKYPLCEVLPDVTLHLVSQE